MGDQNNEEVQRDAFNDIFDDDLVIYGVIPIELVEQL
jgi:hypothetical protein